MNISTNNERQKTVMKNPILTLTTSELKVACKSFYHKEPTPTNMTAFNLTFEELKKRLTEEQFKKFCISL